MNSLTIFALFSALLLTLGNTQPLDHSEADQPDTTVFTRLKRQYIISESNNRCPVDTFFYDQTKQCITCEQYKSFTDSEEPCPLKKH